MISKSQIENKGFTFWRTSDESDSNGEGIRDDYLADRKYKTKTWLNKDVNPPVLLQYYDTGVAKITSYYNQPLAYREYYFIGEINNEEELSQIIEDLPFTLSKINLDKLKIKYA